jgi:hypothetical protein
MPERIDRPTIIEVAGNKPEGSASRRGEQTSVQRGAEHPVIAKLIREYFGA